MRTKPKDGHFYFLLIMVKNQSKWDPFDLIFDLKLDEIYLAEIPNISRVLALRLGVYSMRLV